MAFCAAGLALSIWRNAWRRKKAGPLYPPFEASEVLFTESRVSGHSDKNMLTILGGAHNALVITVLKDAVIIEPSFLKWMVPRGHNDLEHYIRKSDIVSVASGSSFGRKTVEIKFKGEDTSARTISLVVRNSEALLAALDA